VSSENPSLLLLPEHKQTWELLETHPKLKSSSLLGDLHTDSEALIITPVCLSVFELIKESYNRHSWKSNWPVCYTLGKQWCHRREMWPLFDLLFFKLSMAENIFPNKGQTWGPGMLHTGPPQVTLLAQRETRMPLPASCAHLPACTQPLRFRVPSGCLQSVQGKLLKLKDTLGILLTLFFIQE
jgi:hypothetical protein